MSTSRSPHEGSTTGSGEDLSFELPKHGIIGRSYEEAYAQCMRETNFSADGLKFTVLGALSGLAVMAGSKKLGYGHNKLLTNGAYWVHAAAGAAVDLSVRREACHQHILPKFPGHKKNMWTWSLESFDSK
jgi:hypothetical protein